jgi:sugar lactone lactonase YvrE
MKYRGLALLAVLIVLSAAAFAVSPQFWEKFSQEDLLKGTLTRVSLDPEGKLFLAPAYDLAYDTDQPYVFSMVRDKAGNVYIGTGHEGKIFRIDPQGKGSLWYQSNELDIFALALDAADTLYMGTSPDGKVYKVTGQNQGSEFCDTEDKYIWSMIFDDSGNLYVGTGTKGIIYKVDRSGKKSAFFDSDDNNIVSLLHENDGGMLAGTSPGGYVIRVSKEGKAFAILDSSLEEIRALAVDRLGTIYAAASSSTGLTSKSTAKVDLTPDEKTGTLSITTIQTLSNTADKSKDKASDIVTAPGGEKDSSGTRSSIYAISKDGNIETIYASKDQMVFDLITRNDGSVLAATGPKGRLLSINTAKQITVITDSPEEQMTRLTSAPDAVWVAGSNQGRIYKLLPQQAKTGVFESKVFDAKVGASWGKLSSRITNAAGGTIKIFTRSGNTEKPDNSWSDWSTAYAAGSSGQQIASPKARYMQWKAAFERNGKSSAGGQQSDMLDDVQIPYLQRNVSPHVVSINVLPYGIAVQQNSALAGVSIVSGSLSNESADGSSLNSPRARGREKPLIPPRQVFQAGAQSFTWKATDDNDDSLEYSIYFKGEGESDWKLLEKKMTDTFYTIGSASLPDGTYTLKIVASDAPSNPYGNFLVGELMSSPFIISNSTPVIENVDHKLNGKRAEVQFRARVTTGNIATAEFSIDGGDWNLIFPIDGIADSTQEDFQFTTSDLMAGEHILGLRTSDGVGNTGNAKLIVRIP